MQQLMADNTLYVVLSIILIIWLGLALYLLKIDKNVNKLEKRAKLHQEINE